MNRIGRSPVQTPSESRSFAPTAGASRIFGAVVVAGFSFSFGRVGKVWSEGAVAVPPLLVAVT